tara:strand:+ start:2035 stop:4002 length:1968 start_codon:yes stop_codon:yes gene_type:complete
MSYKEDDKPKDLIKKYWADGCHLIPCGSTRDPIPEYFRKKHPFEDDFGLARKWAKTPRVKWSEYIKRKPNKSDITNWYQKFPNCNWAAITGINFVVLDADTYDACMFVEESGITQTPMKQKTPRGGYHYFYSISDHIIKNTTGRLDVRGQGGYVMMQPSNDYELELDEEISSFSDLPKLSMQDINSIYDYNNKGKVSKENSTILATDGVGEGQRNDTLARLVGKWIREGWGLREVIIKALDWNQTNKPPMQLEEVMQTVNSICSGHVRRNPDDLDAGIHKWKTSEWQIKLADELKEIMDQEDPIEQQKKTETQKDPLGLKPFNNDFWEGMDAGRIEQYWGDCFIFQESRVLLVGKPKIGKSHWLGAFAAAATTGTEFMGKQFSRPLKVMWLQAEIIHEFLKNRVDMYYQPFEHDEELLQLGKSNLIASGRLRKNIMRDADMDDIAQSIDYHKPDLLMIDPIINFFSGEENSNQEVHEMLSRVDKLIEMFKVACIIAHHTGKERADDLTFMSARGGSAFAGWMDSGIKLLGTKPNITLFYEARNAKEPEQHNAYFDYQEGCFKMVQPKEGPDEVAIAKVVAKAMDKHKFYTRQDLEILARQALKEADQASGERAGRYAVSYVTKYLGHVVKVYQQPGKNTWYFLAENKAKRPWEDK